MKTTISEMKNTPEGINSRLDEVEEHFGRQGKRKHTIRTAKRKKNFKVRIV